MSKRKNSELDKPSNQGPEYSSNEENALHTHITKKIKKPPAIKIISWPDHDICELINKIEQDIPENDSSPFDKRLEQLNWENINFKKHSVKECQHVLDLLCKKVRKYRLLKEIMADIREMVQHPRNFGVLKHPEKPKKPKKSFMLFIEQNRERLMSENSGLTHMEFLRKSGKIFNELPQSEREVYDNMAKKSREEYHKNLQTFYESHPEFIPKNTTKKTMQLDEGRGPPEKPKTPYELFVKVEAEKKDPDTPKYVFNQKCREEWGEMGDKAKLFWINWSEEQYEKYMEDMKEYVKAHPQYEPERIKHTLTKKEKSIKDKCSGKPDKPPATSYNLFVKMIWESEEINIHNVKDSHYVSEKWKACSKEEKEEYKTRVNQMWEEYYIKLEKYLLTLPAEDRDKVRKECTWRKKSETKMRNITDDAPKVKYKKPIPPPLTDYKYFLTIYKGKENPVEVWESIDAEEKQIYQEELVKKQRKYICEYEKYLKGLSKEELFKLGQSMNEKFDTSTDTESSDEDV